MLILPTAIVALLFSFIVGPFTISQRFQTRRQLLGHRVRQKLASLHARRRAAREFQYYPVAFGSTTIEGLPIASVETSTARHTEITPTPISPQNCVEIGIHGVRPTNANQPRSAPAREFVVISQCQGPFHWHDLLNDRVFKVVVLIFVSIWVPSIAISFIAKLFPRSETLGAVEPSADWPPKLLPPKYISPPTTIHIRTPNHNPHAPPEPVFSSAPSKVPPFWLASEEKQQDQPSFPSPPLLRLLHLPSLEIESRKPLSPLSSPADSGYGTTLPDSASDASPLVSDKSTTTTPEHLDNPLPTSGGQSALAHHSNGTITTSNDFTGENTVGFDIDFDDNNDDDGSITVTNSVANLADMIPRPAPVPAEDLSAKLESLTTTLVEEVNPLPESFVEEPSHDETTADLLSNDEISTDLEIADQDIVVEEIYVDVSPLSVPRSNMTHMMSNPTRVDVKIVTCSGLESIMEEDIAVEDPSRDDLDPIEPWTPDYKIPSINIIPPSQADPEDSARQLDLENGQEESEGTGGSYRDRYEGPQRDGDCDGYPNNYVAEVVPVSPQSPVRDDGTYRSPITKSGLIWSDTKDGDLGPLPFQPELEKPTKLVVDEEPSIEVAPEPIEEQQPTPAAPTQEVIESVPSPDHSPIPQSPHLSASSSIRTQALANTEDRCEGSSGNNRTCGPHSLEQLRFHCCSISKPGGHPKSWGDWEMKKHCIPNKSNLQVYQYVRPTDKDGENPTPRIAIDNLDATWFQKVNGVPSYRYVTEALEFFTTKRSRCWSGRVINGIEHTTVGYATVDFDTLDEAIRMFKELQGRRLRGHTWHWRLEFVDPQDETHGGRKVIRTGLVPDSVKQALAAELEASTRRPERPKRLDDVGTKPVVATRAPVRARRPQLCAPGRSLFAGAITTAVQDRRGKERPTQSSARAPRRPYGS